MAVMASVSGTITTVGRPNGQRDPSHSDEPDVAREAGLRADSQWNVLGPAPVMAVVLPKSCHTDTL